MNEFLPFALPDIGEEEICEVLDTLRSGWLTTGPKTKRFEEEFAEFVGGGVEAIAVNSATAGLHLALEAIGIADGDEVITTPYTFTATAEVVRYLGADPVFVDIDPSTFNIDPLKIESAITSRTKAIIPVHFAGLPCDMDKILEIADRHNLKVVEDAAHALPSVYKGHLVGSLKSHITVFSFYATKTITTGEGGMIVTRDEHLAKRCRVMRLHGISRDAFDRYTSTKPSWSYEVVAPGFKYNMTDMAAAIGLQQLKKAWVFQQRRKEMSQLYDYQLANAGLILPPRADDHSTHSWHLYVVRLTNEIRLTRDEFIEKMANNGVGCSVHFIPLHMHPYWRDRYSLKPNDFKNSKNLFDGAVSLPIYTKMTQADQLKVVDSVMRVIG